MRARTTAAAVGVVGLALALGALGLLLLLRDSLVAGVRTAAVAEAVDVAALARGGVLPRPLPALHGDDVAQVVDAAGRVVASTGEVAGRGPVSRLRPAEGRTVVRVVPSLPVGDADRYLLVATTVGTPEGPETVYAAGSLDPVGASVRTVGLALAAGLPLLLLLVGGLTYLLTGRALRPVEAIRKEVADLTASGLHRRVPEPPVADEVGLLARTMNAMLERLEEAALRQRRFVSDASHELRSPLATILAEAEVALAHPERAAVEEVATAVLEEARRLERVVEDLLLLARGDEHGLGTRRLPVDLGALVSAEAERLRGNGRVSCEVEMEPVPSVLGDPDELGRALRNLVDNAERHAASWVRLELRPCPSGVELAVADDGPGIPVEHRARVFERFTRLDTSRQREAGGAGLGLAIVSEVVAAHGGQVAIADAPRGARFVVWLPAPDGGGAPALATGAEALPDRAPTSTGA